MMHYPVVLYSQERHEYAVQWDEITISEWQEYADCVTEIKRWSDEQRLRRIDEASRSTNHATAA